jgi:antitoxin HicB
MMSNYTDEATRLANQPYTTIVFRDMTTDGEYGYVAINPQLPGCVSDGDTPEEAIDNLLDARILYIETSLEDGLSIPKPLLANNVFIEIDMKELLGEEINSIPEDTKHPTQSVLLSHLAGS